MADEAAPRPPRHSQMREAATAISEFVAQMAFSSAAVSSMPLTDANATLALAATKLRQHDHPEASKLFASVVHNHDVREGWLGLAIAYHFQGETIPAGIALAHALSHHAITIVPPIANSIAKSIGALGWCALDHEGTLTVQSARALRGRRQLTASVDGKPLLLRTKPDGRIVTGRLPEWCHGRELRVHVDNVELMGSPIRLLSIARIEGFADSRNGDLHGWAWCPNNPDYDPVLSIVPHDQESGLIVVASNPINVAQSRHWPGPAGFTFPPISCGTLTDPFVYTGSTAAI
jgi:hypothetical protein